MKKFLWLLGSVLLCVSLVLVIFSLTSPKLQASAKNADGIWSKVTLPWIFPNQANDQELRIDLNANWFTSRVWHIIPDDDLRSIRVNGSALKLDTLKPGALTDWSNGFVLDLSQVLHSGANRIDFVVSNHGGPGGIALTSQSQGVRRAVAWGLTVFAFVPFLFVLSWLFRLRWFQLAILILSLIPLAAYWSVTPYSVRGHDVMGPGGHLDYVAVVAKNLALPRPDAGWTFYHPPLYYVSGAVFYRLAERIGVPCEQVLQAFSLGLWLLAMAAFAGTLRMALRGRPWALAIATSALAFWPSSMLQSIRLGNDVMLYAMVAVSSYFFIRWWRSNRFADLRWMSLFAALALLSKTNALALVGAMGLLVLWRVFYPGKRGRRTAVLGLVVFSCVIALGLGLSLADNVYYYSKGEIQSWLVSNSSGLNSGLRVGTELKNFIPLDVPTFLTEPWMSPWSDHTGRSNFWNYLLRSSFSGEFSYGDGLFKVISYLWGAILLLLLCLGFARGWPSSAASAFRNRPWILLGLFWIASEITLRIKLPFACSNDFRYIWPVLVPALVWFARSGIAALLLLMMIPVLSTVFYLAL